MIKRFVDDSNQIAETNADYGPDTIVKKLVEIANSVDEGTVMEEDTCDNHSNRRIPILDMECWLDAEGYAVYCHYEKEVSTKLVIPARSAHSNSTKRSMFINEVVRRILNTSRRLEWDTFVAPALTDYMSRMMAGGYSENYRMNILLNAYAVYDGKVRLDNSGECPLNRPTGYRRIQRRNDKIRKKTEWSTKGGFISPLIIPATPGGILAKMLREVVEAESDENIRFKVVEKGGLTLERMFQKANPTASGKCGKPDCYMDNQPEEGGNCHKSNVLYEWTCRECSAKYIGETSRNFYTRSIEHISKNNNKAAESFMYNHQKDHHNDQPPNFKVRVLKSFQEALSRQVYEGTYIRNIQGEKLNTNLDYYGASTYHMRKEVLHG